MVSATKGGRKVQFGIFDWIERDENSPAQIFEDRLKLLEYADKQDFFCYHLAEHHTTPLSVAPSPGIFLSAAAQRTSRIRPGSPGFPAAPLQSPASHPGGLHAGPPEPRPPGVGGRPGHRPLRGGAVRNLFRAWPRRSRSAASHGPWCCTGAHSREDAAVGRPFCFP